MEFVTRTGKTSQPHPLESMMNLQVSEPHLDTLSIISRLQESFRFHEATGYVTGILMKIAGNSPSWLLGTTHHLQGTNIAIELGGSIKECPPLMYSAASVEHLLLGQI